MVCDHGYCHVIMKLLLYSSSVYWTPRTFRTNLKFLTCTLPPYTQFSTKSQSHLVLWTFIDIFYGFTIHLNSAQSNTTQAVTVSAVCLSLCCIFWKQIRITKFFPYIVYRGRWFLDILDFIYLTFDFWLAKKFKDQRIKGVFLYFHAFFAEMSF
jgi:hypothetical protein